MSKENNFLESSTIEVDEVTPNPVLVKLDDLTLALIGGGAAGVEF